MFRRQLRSAPAGAISALLLLAACGGSDEFGESDTSDVVDDTPQEVGTPDVEIPDVTTDAPTDAGPDEELRPDAIDIDIAPDAVDADIGEPPEDTTDSGPAPDVDAGDDVADALPVCLEEDRVQIYADEDGDGFGFEELRLDCEADEGESVDGGDCNDDDDAIFPDAQEVCDGIDNDCDDEIDEDAITVGDACASGVPGVCATGSIVCEEGELACAAPAPRSELCNGLDDDCDGATDEGAGGGALTRACYQGPEGTRGVGICADGAQACTDGVFSGCAGQVIPEDGEFCNGLDDDCNGLVDDSVDFFTVFVDLDGDGFGTTPVTEQVCVLGDNQATVGGDCNDALDSIFPGAAETANGVDDDCDERIDNGTPVFDNDNDGFCAVGPCVGGLPDGDCNDTNNSVFPGATEAIDGIDNDCDDVVDNNNPRYDDDNDGYCEIGPCITGLLGEGDCDDTNDTVFPGAPEIVDGLDNNCNDVADDSRRWLGGSPADPTDWQVGENWAPVGVPTATDGVFIGADRADQPRLTVNASCGSIFLEDGAELDVQSFVLTVDGDVRAGNTISGAGSVRITGDGARVEGSLPSLRIEGSVELTADTTITGNLTVANGGQLRLNGQTTTVSGDFVNTVGRTSPGLVLLDESDELYIGGDATFSNVNLSQSAIGALAAGLISVGGDLIQTYQGGGNRAVLAPTGTLFLMTGALPTTINLASGGLDGSFIDGLQIAPGATVELLNNIWVTGLVLVEDGAVLQGADLFTAGPLPANTPGYTVDRTHISTTRAIDAAEFTGAALLVDTGVTTTFVQTDFDIAGDLTVNGTLRAPTDSLTVEGSLTLNSRLQLPTGFAFFGGDATIRGARAALEIGAARAEFWGTTVITKDAADLQGVRLQSPDADLVFEGDAVFTTEEFGQPTDTTGMRQGTIWFRGDLTQAQARFANGNSLIVDGATVVFDGEELQVVTFASSGVLTSRLSNVTFANPTEINLASNVFMTGSVDHLAGRITGSLAAVIDELPTVEVGWEVQELQVAGDVTVDSDKELTCPGIAVVTGGTLTINEATLLDATLVARGGTLVFNEVLTITGAVSAIDSGVIRGNAGSLDVPSMTLNTGGELRPAASFVHIHGPLTVRQRSSVTHGLIVVDDSAEVIVDGLASFSEETFTTVDTATTMTAGVLELRGGLTQTANTGSAGRAFAPDGMLVRLGAPGQDLPQTIQFSASGADKSRLDDVEVVSGTVTLGSNVWVTGHLEMSEAGRLVGSDVFYTTELPFTDAGAYSVSRTHIAAPMDLSSQLTPFVSPRLVVDAGVNQVLAASLDLVGDVTISGTVDFAGHTLDIDGELLVQGGTASLAGGELHVSGGAQLTDAGSGIIVSGGTVRIDDDMTVTVQSTFVGLVMVDEPDQVFVGGSLAFRDVVFSTGSSAGRLTAGSIHVGGNFIQSAGTGSAGTGFVSTGTRVVMDGTAPQQLAFGTSGPTQSLLHDLTIENPAGVTITNNLLIQSGVEVLGSCIINSGRTVTVDGNITLGSTSTLDVRGTLIDGGCLAEPGATIVGAYVCD